MKRIVGIALLAAAGFAHADELGEAKRLLAAKSYDKALPIYQRLAEAGNAEAQMRLGEMYWFGDGTAPDLATARQWFERSASKGNADAVASLEALKRRDTRGGEIVYWTARYQGEDMVSGKFACTPPALPTLSRTKAEIKAVGKQIDEWRACYNGFVDNMNDALPPGKRIPADVVDMMTPAEGAQAQRHLDSVYGKLSAKAKSDAAAFAAREAAWRKATETFVQTEATRSDVLTEDIERAQHRRMQEANLRLTGAELRTLQSTGSGKGK